MHYSYNTTNYNMPNKVDIVEDIDNATSSCTGLKTMSDSKSANRSSDIIDKNRTTLSCNINSEVFIKLFRLTENWLSFFFLMLK